MFENENKSMNEKEFGKGSEVGVSETAGCSTADDFEKWLSGFQGLMASNPDILYFDSYEDILKERLKAAFISGAASIACKP